MTFFEWTQVPSLSAVISIVQRRVTMPPFAVSLFELVEIATEGDRRRLAVEPEQSADHIGFAVGGVAVDLAEVVGDVVARHVEVGAMPCIGLRRVVRRHGDHRAVFVDAIFPPATGDLSTS